MLLTSSASPDGPQPLEPASLCLCVFASVSLCGCVSVSVSLSLCVFVSAGGRADFFCLGVVCSGIASGMRLEEIEVRWTLVPVWSLAWTRTSTSLALTSFCCIFPHARIADCRQL